MPRNLLTHPCCAPEDLGKPLPDSPHATSVALPCWDHVVGYEEGRADILNAMELGYPRFVFHPKVAALLRNLEAEWGEAGERCLAFPTAEVAARCAQFLQQRGWTVRRIATASEDGVHAVFFPGDAFEDAKAYWQHFGKIISSRRAEALLEGLPTPVGGDEAKERIRQRIADSTGAGAEDVWLLPSGMAAVSRALRLAQERQPGARSIQMGFPYVDVYKVQNVAGPGAHFVPDYDLDVVAEILSQESISAIVCEFPGNPLLGGTRLSALSTLARTHGVPLIVDDTPATYVNVRLFPYADMVVTSLTKAFSGEGDVMAGAVVLNPESPLAPPLRTALGPHGDALFWDGDAIALEANSRDFVERVQQMNRSTEALCEHLKQHPLVKEVFYPKYTMKDAYDEVLRPGGGYGSLFSMTFHDGARHAPAFYDALGVSKGPSLGNNFTLVCPYTLLAHYTELPWAETHGVSRYLIRVSVGLEAIDELQARFDRALATLSD